jgi:hypothetical protein
MTNNIDKQSFGEAGFEMRTGSATFTTGDYCALQFVTDSTLTSIAAPLNSASSVAVTGITYPAGFVIFTPFTSAVIATGTAIAYKAL